MLKNLTRGGQTFLHAYRMVMQIANVLLIWFFFFFILCTVVWMYLNTQSYDYYVSGKLIEAKFIIGYSHIYEVLGMPNLALTAKQMSYVNYNGTTSIVMADNLLNQSGTYYFLDRIKNIFFEGVFISFIISLIAISIIGWLLNKKGEAVKQEEHLRGASLTNAQALQEQILATSPVSHLTTADIPLPQDSETQHVLITGTTGAGKSVCMSELLRQIRQQAKRAIVYDNTGAYTERFYRPGKDIILNPLDKRSPGWHIWAECKIDAHYDAIAESLMPMPTTGQDPFWVMAARVMFAVAARRLKQQGEANTLRLLRYLLMADLNRIQELIADSEAESLVADKAEKLALSVKAILSTYLRSFRYLNDNGPIFSIRNWIKKEDDSWIFITSREDQHATLKPLISTYLDIAANAVLSLKRDPNRRIFLSLDEMDSLQYLPSIKPFLTKGRKYGACAMLGIQAISQFYENFGENDAETIISCCNTGIHFRSRGKITAAYIADLLGEYEVIENNEQVSFGNGNGNSSVSHGQHKNVRQLILPSQIKQLNDLQAYLHLKGDLPITKINYQYVPYPVVQPDFVPREIVLDTTLENTIKEIRTQAKNQDVKVPVLKKRKPHKDQKSLVQASHHGNEETVSVTPAPSQATGAMEW